MESCDDGNSVNGDGCSSTCTIEDAFTCTRIDNTAANPDICTLRCGNGALDSTGSHIENCDDGNVIANDGCSFSCSIEDAFTCSRTTNSAATPDICTHKCGNGALDPAGTYTESCDDGNTSNGDGCSDSCATEDAFTCSRNGPTSADPDQCTHKCGNGALDSQGSYTEQCDDSNTVDGDGCNSSCTGEEGFSCDRTDNSAANPDTCYDKCGNGALDNVGSYMEECDDGNALPLDGCGSDCMVEEGFSCSRADAASPDVCESLCGNSVRENEESYREECDDGSRENGDGCSSTCTVERGWECIQTNSP